MNWAGSRNELQQAPGHYFGARALLLFLWALSSLLSHFVCAYIQTIFQTSSVWKHICNQFLFAPLSDLFEIVNEHIHIVTEKKATAPWHEQQKFGKYTLTHWNCKLDHLEICISVCFFYCSIMKMTVGFSFLSDK